MSGVSVDIKLIMFTAMKSNASGIIICNNHPSGNLMPSKQDKLLTQKVKEAGEILDLPLLDHIIEAPDGFFSFSDEGLLSSLFQCYKNQLIQLNMSAFLRRFFLYNNLII